MSNDEPIDDDLLLSLIEANRHPDGKPNASAIAEAMGRSRSGVQRALRRVAREGREPFEVPEGHSVKGVSALVDADGLTIQQWIKTKVDTPEVSLTREAIAEMFAEYRGKSEFIPSPGVGDPDRIALFPTADFHLSMLSWRQETGRSWDLKIARKTMLDAAGELIQCTPAAQTAILLDLGDYFHANDQTNATPAHKHRLDVDGRFARVAKEGVKLRRELIELALQKYDRVIYRGVPGNHDPEASMWLTVALSLFFENNPRVTIDDDPGDFWFYQHGKTFLAANHGHKTKPDKLPGIMATDRPEWWGRTKHKYAFSGHIHRERSGEALGARWETLRTISPTDAHAHQSGYRSGRELISIVYSAERGEITRQTVSVC